jgi:hypothetical protein
LAFWGRREEKGWRWGKRWGRMEGRREKKSPTWGRARGRRGEGGFEMG